MTRIHLFEFTDQPWYPDTFRRMQTDYLQFAASMGAGHKNLLPLFAKAMQHARTTEIVDLCSGGTGPWVRLLEHFRQAGLEVTVKLTDKYPHPDALQRWQQLAQPGIEYLSEPVDARQTPVHLTGMRTLFEGFHHFKPDQARLILQDAQNNSAAIGIFEASPKLPLGHLMLLLTPIITPLTYALITPTLKPRTAARFLWTYLIPLVPLATCWDGLVSMLRVYSIRELQELVAPLQNPDYTWEIGKLSTGTPVFDFTYLIGYPTLQDGSEATA
ncbi:MAG: hypothetical protein JXB15_12730 [Anaerolineales bacterium]|nr:hypothetical protein [Anaerolineales bacterium]